MRAATAKPLAKEHFGQVGEYQLQDAFLSDPFQVNLALVQNAYTAALRGSLAVVRAWRCTLDMMRPILMHFGTMRRRSKIKT